MKSHEVWKQRAPDIEAHLNAGASVGDLANMYGCAPKTILNRLAELRNEGLLNLRQSVEEKLPEYKTTVEIGSDGTHKSDKLLRMSEEQSKDIDYLLKAHGYDKNVWQLISARSNIWNTNDKINGVQTLYASKISVKPKEQKWKYEDLLKSVQSVPAIHIPDSFISESTDRMLEIPLYDTHFGISDLDHYRHTQSDTLDFLRSKTWEQVEITIGQDLLHNDNFRGTTANGTPIESVDMPNAWLDALKFYAPIIAVAKKQSKAVKIIYSKGNHDESMSWAFVKNLRSLFPWALYDDIVKERKVHLFHRCFIGITHGDKTPPRELVTLFATEFAQEWAQAVTREIHKGHIHKEDATDDYGAMVRTLATRNKTDLWHQNNGFTRPHKRFQLFEWDHNELKDIHYV